MKKNLRYIAAQVINEVTEGHALSDSLDNWLSSIKEPRDRGLVQAICYGVCRFYTRLDVVLSFLLVKPMNAKDSDVHALLLVGLYQLMEMRVPAHAAVSETVDATDALRKPWARGLVNAVLREYQRKQETLQQEIADDEEAHFAHPLWWIDAIKKAWPQQWEAILNENNMHPPFSLRVNQLQGTREAYLEKLTNANMEATIIPETSDGITLVEATSVESLPGCGTGAVSVQDGAAQLAATLLELAPGQHILDACAAPGGKLTHILECDPTATAVAVEKDQHRMASIQENLQRLGLKATCINNDANHTQGWWDRKLFDRILVDAPCSASGVIRRHPDIKLLRQSSDIPNLAREQMRIVNALWPLLAPGGMLVYATCSIFNEENSDVMQAFLAQHEDASEVKIEAEWGIPCEVGRQILPGMHGMDGFYYARLRKAHS